MSDNNAAPNPMSIALDALKTGKDIDQAINSTPGLYENNAVVAEEKPEIQVMDASAELTESAKESTDEETLSVETAVKVETKDEKPAKGKPPVDDKLKQYEKGMRKFQAERDQLAKKFEETSKKLAEVETNWNSLESAYSNQGLEGVINTISGDPEGYKKFLDREFAKKREFENATPTQKREMELQEQLSREKRSREQIEKRIKDMEEKTTGERVVAEQKSLEATVNPIFEKYRFTGKLGDDEAEYYYDKALWRETLDNVEQLPEESITRETIENEFKKVANAYRKVINKQADNKVKKVIDSKKQSAQENAAVKAMSGMTDSAAVDNFKGAIRGGNITDAFRQLMSGKVKLS